MSLTLPDPRRQLLDLLPKILDHAPQLIDDLVGLFESELRHGHVMLVKFLTTSSVDGQRADASQLAVNAYLDEVACNLHMRPLKALNWPKPVDIFGQTVALTA